MLQKPEFRLFNNLSDMSRAAAGFIIDSVRIRLLETDRFSLVLSGGKTPQLLYKLLAETPFCQQMSWDKIHIFWGDERCVPPDHKFSNFAMAYSAFLYKSDIQSANIHRIRSEIDPPEEAAKDYANELNNFFHNRNPSFDLVLLGLGNDGHTASLFPGTSVLQEKKRWVAVVSPASAVPPVQRISLTFPIINLARKIVFLVSGPEKFEIANEILHDPNVAVEHYPAAGIRQTADTIWFMSRKNE